MIVNCQPQIALAMSPVERGSRNIDCSDRSLTSRTTRGNFRNYHKAPYVFSNKHVIRLYGHLHLHEKKYYYRQMISVWQRQLFPLLGKSRRKHACHKQNSELLSESAQESNQRIPENITPMYEENLKNVLRQTFQAGRKLIYDIDFLHHSFKISSLTEHLYTRDAQRPASNGAACPWMFPRDLSVTWLLLKM